MLDRRFREIYNPQEVTTVVAAVIFNPDESNVLVGQRSLKSDFFPGQWEFIGGRKKPEDDLGSAVIKEAFERAGLKVQPENYMGYEGLNYEGDIGEIVTFYIKCVFLSLTHALESPTDSYNCLKWVKIISDPGGENLMTLGFIPSDKTFAQKLLAERLLKGQG